MTYWNFDETREVDFAGGSCLIIRRDATAEVGLLDENFFMYTEEADWSYRFKMHGWKTYFLHDAQIVHLGGQSSRKYGSDILLHLYSSRNKFISKHKGEAASMVHRAIIVLGALSRVLAFGIVNLGGKGNRDAIGFQIKLLRWALHEKEPTVRQSKSSEDAK